MTATPPDGAGGDDLSTGAVADGLQQVVDALAARLGRSVAVDDTKGRLVTVSRHFGDEDEMRVHALIRRESDPRVLAHFRAYGIYDWHEPGRTGPNPDIGFRARVVCPARAHGISFGHLFLVDDGVEDREVELARAAAGEIGRLMYRRLVLHEQGQDRREQLVGDLLAPSAETRVAAHRALAAERGIDETATVVATVVEMPDANGDEHEPVLRAALERATRDRLAVRPLLAVRGSTAILLLSGDAAEPGNVRALASAAVAEAGKSTGRRLVAGLGAPGTGVDAALRSYEDARVAAQAATLLPALGDVVDDGALGVYAVLLRLPPGELGPSLYPEPLRRLLGHESGTGLVRTLEAYLDEGCDATRTAARLRVHRSTLYYRLGRIESIAATSLRDGHHRLALHLGTKARRLIEARRSGGR